MPKNQLDTLFIESLMEKISLISNDSDDFRNSLFERKYNWCDDISGGELKKIFIINAIIECPDILILDETFGPLDPYSQKDIFYLIKNDSCLNLDF